MARKEKCSARGCTSRAACRVRWSWPLCKKHLLQYRGMLRGYVSAEETWYDDHVIGIDDILDLFPGAPVVDGDRRVDVEELKVVVDQVLGTITSREREIIILRFGLQGYSYTLRECARIFKVAPERVGQIERLALCKLRSRLRIERLLPWVDWSKSWLVESWAREVAS